MMEKDITEDAETNQQNETAQSMLEYITRQYRLYTNSDADTFFRDARYSRLFHDQRPQSHYHRHCIRGPGWRNRLLNLPEGVKHLQSTHQKLTNIENLPSSLESIDLSHNQLTSFDGTHLEFDRTFPTK